MTAELTMVDARNQRTYSTPSIVRHYVQLQQLQPAEQTILVLLQDQLSRMTMLDIGVGGGRTTQHFYQNVADYIGIDYCPEMIAACHQRFSESLQPPSFEVCDARNMSRFPDDRFDFILFSFNGIDYVSHSDRLRVFSEIHRVGKPGGYFCFSSHNLKGAERAFDWRQQLRTNPIKTYENLVMLLLLRWLNPRITLTQLKTSTYLILKDESHNFRLQTYYIRPEAQIKQLAPSFSEVKVYSWQSGLELTGEHELPINPDLWLYYLCRMT